MSTNGWVLVDLVVSVLAAGGWLGAGALAAGAAASAGRARIAAALAGLGLLATAGRVATTGVLLSAGWWFAQEKVLLTVPLAVVGVAAALVAAGRPLWATVRGRAAGSVAAGSVSAGAVVALFAAGIAGAAGPAYTVLHGFSATWSGALLTLALVGGAVTLVARVLGVTRLRTPAAGSLALALVGAALAIASPPSVDLGGVDLGGVTSVSAGSVVALGGTGGVRAVADLVGPTEPAVGGQVRRYTLTARTATLTLASGTKVAAWTFDGQVPGPPVTATVGDLIEVTLRNADIGDGVTLHWHGYDVPAAEDGVPGLTQDAVRPGQEYVYRFLANRAGTFWYHTHEVSDKGVRLGLYGMLVVAPREAAPEGLDLTLPVHTLGGTVVLGPDAAPAPRAVAPGTGVRLRLVNTDDEPRVYAVAGTPFTVTAVDGTDLVGPEPVAERSLRVPAGGRYDVAFTMPASAVAVTVSGVTLSLTPPGAGPAAPAPTTWPVLDLLHYGKPAGTPFGATSAFDRRFDLVLDRGLALVSGKPSFAFTVNGHAYPNIPVETVREGDLVEFTVVNRSQVVHPWHLHGHRVLVLSRDGVAPTGSPLWLDTFDVRPGEVWRVAFRADNPGLWMNHCHNLAHANNGMALHLAYEGVGASFHGGHGG